MSAASESLYEEIRDELAKGVLSSIGQDRDRASRESVRIEPVLALIERQLFSRGLFEELKKALPAYLLRDPFREAVGWSLTAYVVKSRMPVAEELLRVTGIKKIVQVDRLLGARGDQDLLGPATQAAHGVEVVGDRLA